MRRKYFACAISILITVLILAGVFSSADAETFRFDTDPFAGTTALTTPGRQVVGGEDSISFNIASDIFSLESTLLLLGFGLVGLAGIRRMRS